MSALFINIGAYILDSRPTADWREAHFECPAEAMLACFSIWDCKRHAAQLLRLLPFNYRLRSSCLGGSIG